MANRCSSAAPADPCRPTAAVNFRAGVSTRRIPGCSPSRCESSDCGMGALWVNNSGTLDSSEWLGGWCINQLSARAQATCDETLTEKPGGGWWADAFRGQGSGTAGFRSGSKLWTLRGQLSTNERLLLAKRYAEEALAWLVSAGVAMRIEVTATLASSRAINLAITIIVPGSSAEATITGQQQPDYSWAWS